MNRCDWAGCTRHDTTWESGWWHCSEHLAEHRALTLHPGDVKRVGRPRAECGSPSAYRRHLKLGEVVDEACRQANADDKRRRQQREKAKRAQKKQAA